MWTIYDHPSDFPDCFIARRWEVVDGFSAVATQDTRTSPKLDELRASFARDGLVSIQRMPLDDKIIVEVWL